MRCSGCGAEEGYRHDYECPVLLAKMFHNTYEALAPKFGYITKHETRVWDEDSPNGKLMVEVCRRLKQSFDIRFNEEKHADSGRAVR